MQMENKNCTNEPCRGVTKVGSGDLPEDSRHTIFETENHQGCVRRAMQLHWMHQHVPQQPDYYQVCMEWYDFRLIKTVITVSSAFHNVNIKIYEVPRVCNRHNSKRMRSTEKKRKIHTQSKRCIRLECAYANMIYTILLFFTRKITALQ